MFFLQDERERVEKLGGHITHVGTLRVNGLLAITRAIGNSLLFIQFGYDRPKPEYSH